MENWPGRAAPRHLTAFFLWMSLGGVLGGLFNALAAPLLFVTLAEYPIAIVLAALLLPRLEQKKKPGTVPLVLDLVLPLFLALVSIELFQRFPFSRFMGLEDKTINEWFNSFAQWSTIDTEKIVALLLFTPTVILCYLFGFILDERPLRFGLGVAALLLVHFLPENFASTVVYRDRSFFGTLKVTASEAPPRSAWENFLCLFRPLDIGEEGPTTGFTLLAHGTTRHGQQNRDPKHRRDPLSYYHRTGPIGQVFEAFQGDQAKRDIAVIGLGTGTMACYPDAGQSLTFYEIDRKVKAISFDQKKYFSFVKDAQERGAEINIVMGDARLQLDRERKTDPDAKKYDIIVVDAFSSDAIPVHLMTRQALEIYLARLKPDGIVAFHTSNRYLRLEPVVVNLAADLGYVSLEQKDEVEDDSELGRAGKCSSNWVMVARAEKHFGKLLEDKRWKRQLVEPDLGVWSDDFCNLVKIFQW